MERLIKRWGVQYDDQTYFSQFKNRITNTINMLINSLDFDTVNFIDYKFCNYIGFAIQYNPTFDISFTKPLNMYNIFSNENNSSRFCLYIQLLLSLISKSIKSSKENKQHNTILITNLALIINTVKQSPGINLRITIKDDEPILLRSGAKLLDEKLVDDNLSWLEDFPKILKSFSEALEIYLMKDENKYRNLLDNLRFSLEQLLRILLRNKKSLENQKTEFLIWLKKKGVHQQLINQIEKDLFGTYMIYQNEAVKHSEEFSSNEIEFLIYQTGVYLRFFIQLINVS